MTILMQKIELSRHEYWFLIDLATKFAIMIVNHDK